MLELQTIGLYITAAIVMIICIIIITIMVKETLSGLMQIADLIRNIEGIVAIIIIFIGIYYLVF